MVPFTSKEGTRLFSGLRNGETDYAAISSFAPQQHPNFCGVASAVSVLAIQQRRGHAVAISPETFQDHEKLFTPAIEEIRTLSQVKGLVDGDYPGLAIEDLKKILSLSDTRHVRFDFLKSCDSSLESPANRDIPAYL